MSILWTNYCHRFSFFKDRIRGQKKDNPFADGRTLFDRTRQSGQKGRVWPQVGYQSNWRRISPGLSSQRLPSRIRSKVLFGGNQVSPKKFWKSSQNLRIRPWWLQRVKHKEGEKTWSEERGHCSNWKNGMGSQRSNAQENSTRAGPSRGRYWNDQIQSLWLQQTKCKEHCGNGMVRPACDFRVQYEEINAGMVCSANSSGDKLIRFSQLATKVSQSDETRYGMCG